MEQPRSERNFWPFLAAATVIVIVVAAIRWSFAHPYGIHWDESQYLDEVGIDVQRLLNGNFLKLGGRILIKGWGIPPAYRLLALPFVGLLGFHTTVARLVSLACFGLSSWFIYLATRRIGGQVAGGIAVLTFALSPEVVSASIFFGTDASLYLATSAMLYYLFAFWSDSSEHPSNWIGLGLAVGLGFLSKTSFVLIALPVLGFALVVRHYKYPGVPSLASQIKAAGLASFIAGPWWLLNVRSALAYAHYSRDFVRNSLGQPSFMTWIRWLNTVLQCLLGHGVSILIGLVVIACFRKAVIKKEMILNPLQRAALSACACAGVPIVITQLSGTNHLLRHISPAVIPLAVTIGVLSVQTGWIGSKVSIAVASSLFCVQLLMILTPTLFPNNHPVSLGFVNGGPPWRVMSRFDQWDWRPVREISNDCGLASPKISFLGGGHVFNPPAIQYPWVLHGASTDHAALGRPDVTWLWRYEDGPLNWQKVMDSAGQADFVLTAPRYNGGLQIKGDLDNQHNAEFAGRLSRDPHFREPIRIEMGRFEPVEIELFVKKTAVCQSGQEVSANRQGVK